MDKMTEERLRNMTWVGGYAEKLLRMVRAVKDFRKHISEDGCEGDRTCPYRIKMWEALKEVEHLVK